MAWRIHQRIIGGLPLATCIIILFTIIFPNIASSLSSTGKALGTALLYLFFATAGAPGLAVADSVKKSFLPIGLFLSLLYGIHGAMFNPRKSFCAANAKETVQS